MIEVTLFGAFTAGLLSFFSPCVLPLAPFFLSYLTGSSFQGTGNSAAAPANRWSLIISSLVFSAGILTVFVALGASASAIGQVLRDWFPILRWVAAALMIAMGLHFLGIISVGLFARDARFQTRSVNPASLAGAYLVGMAFAFGWTPCVGPMLSLILILAANATRTLEGVLLLVVYGAGMCLPFVTTAAFAQPALRALGRTRGHLKAIERLNGIVLVAFGFLIGTGGMAAIGFWMQRTFPVFQGIG